MKVDGVLFAEVALAARTCSRLSAFAVLSKLRFAKSGFWSAYHWAGNREEYDAREDGKELHDWGTGIVSSGAE